MNAKELRIVYMGTPEFAVPPLRMLVEEGYNVVAVVTAPDRPAGRGLKLQPSAVKRYALEAGLPVLQPVKLKDESFVKEFAGLRADLGIVIAFRMLPEVVWSNPVYGTFNLHASLLPQYRGAAPINRAVMNGETLTGLTTFLLNAGMDRGAILLQREVSVSNDDTAGTLHDRLMELGPQIVKETIEKIASGTAAPVDQPAAQERELKPAPKIFKEDCLIHWDMPGLHVRNLVRGLSPYPAAWSVMETGDGESLQVKIFSVRFEESRDPEDTPGKIISDGKSFIKVSCSDGYIYIEELQAAGKKRMSAPEFLRGIQGVGLLRAL